MVSWSETVSLDVRSSIADQSLLETGITAAVNGAWSETVSLDVRSSIADQSLWETGITAAVNGVLVRDCFTGCQE